MRLLNLCQTKLSESQIFLNETESYNKYNDY